MALCWIMGVRNSVCTATVFWCPLMCASRTFGQFPFKAKQIFKEIIAEFGGRCCPRHLKAAGDGITGFAGLESAGPAQSLGFHCSGFRFRPKMCSRPGTVGFAKAVAPCNKCYGFFIIHRHACESFANVACRSQRIRFSVRPFRIDIDQAHLHGSQRVG